MRTLLPVALLLGALLPVQVGVNARLRAVVGHPVLAAAISFAVGALALAALAAAAGALRLPASAAARVPWWGWTGGLLGAAYILGAILLAPRLGAAAFTAAIVAGQLLAALLVDHFGAIGFARQPVTPGRLAGAALLALGVLLVQRR
jgi:transporter family-2 protein